MKRWIVYLGQTRDGEELYGLYITGYRNPETGTPLVVKGSLDLCIEESTRF